MGEVTQLGVDYAGGKPGGAALAAAGFSFAARYLTSGGPGLPGKLLTPQEYLDLQAHGIAVVANWETTATRMLGGFNAGVLDAQSAQAQLVVVGHPLDRPVFFSADWDATPTQQAPIDAYLRGAATVLGAQRVGVYSGYWVVSRCLDNGSAVWAWQAMAWSGGNVDPRAHLVQHIETVVVDGVECDVNQAQQLPDYGQHPLPTHEHRRERDMDELPATAPPPDPNSDPRTWPQINHDVGFTPGTGWAGVFGVQEWGGRTQDGARGFLLLASWETPTGLEPVASVFTTQGGGAVIYDHAPTVPLVAPPTATGLTLNYAAPGGAFIGV